MTAKFAALMIIHVHVYFRVNAHVLSVFTWYPEDLNKKNNYRQAILYFSFSQYVAGDLQALRTELILLLERLGQVQRRAIFCTLSHSF